MKMLQLPLLVLLLLAAGTVPGAAQTDDDHDGVRDAVLDYVEGIYNVEPDRIARSVHPKLTKLGYGRNPDATEYRESAMTFEQLHRLAGNYNKEGRIPQDAPKEIVVLDVLDKIASAKLVADWGIDYFQLAKLDGKWMIVHVMWQSHPPK